MSITAEQYTKSYRENGFQEREKNTSYQIYITSTDQCASVVVVVVVWSSDSVPHSCQIEQTSSCTENSLPLQHLRACGAFVRHPKRIVKHKCCGCCKPDRPKISRPRPKIISWRLLPRHRLAPRFAHLQALINKPTTTNMQNTKPRSYMKYKDARKFYQS